MVASIARMERRTVKRKKTYRCWKEKAIHFISSMGHMIDVLDDFQKANDVYYSCPLNNTRVRGTIHPPLKIENTVFSLVGRIHRQNSRDMGLTVYLLKYSAYRWTHTV